MSCRRIVGNVDLLGKGARRAIAAVSFAVAMAISSAALATVAQQIIVEGNQRIEVATIKSYMVVKQGTEITPTAVNESIKRLFATGLFKDVRINPVGERVIVQVAENPMINEVAFEGNERIKDEDLALQVQSRSRTPFTVARTEGDAAALVKIYRRAGRYGATVDPKIIKLDDNRVNVVFEIDEGPLTGVSGISFVGNKTYSDHRLRQVIKTDESTFFNFLSSSDNYDPDRLEYDKELLRRFYLARGYADFSVISSTSELSPDREGFYITFTVEEGKKYDFGPINLITDIPDFDTKPYADLVLPKEGEAYDGDLLDKTVRDVNLKLGELGQPFVEVKLSQTKNSENSTVNINFNLAEGRPVYVQRIDIEGNVRTLDKVIRREMELVEGDAFNAYKLDRSRSKVRALGFFQKVDVSTQRGAANDQRVVKVAVVEQSTGDISFGLGYSSADSIGGTISITERNLLGRGQFLRFSIAASADRQLYELRFTEPYFLDRDLRAGFDFFRIDEDNSDESSYQETKNTFRPRVNFPLSENSRMQLRYQVSMNKIRDISDDTSPIIALDKGTEISSLVGYTLTYDQRNDLVKPTSGYIARFSQDFAGLGGDAKFIRSIGTITGYTSFFNEDVVGKLELEAGGIYGFDYNVRVTNRFFLGGDNFRGFRNSGMGPRDFNTDDALGGNIYTVARADLSFPLGLPDEYGMFGGVFFDAGTLYKLDRNSVTVGGNTTTVDDDPKLRASAGVAFYWSSPFGPTVFNLATPILKEDGDEKETFRFTAGTRF